jgi:hypothetical protein
MSERTVELLLGNGSVNMFLRQRIRRQNQIISTVMQRGANTTLDGDVFPMWFAYSHCLATHIFSTRASRYCISSSVVNHKSNPCGGGVECPHRYPASRRRRRKGKYKIWDISIWSRVQRDSDPRKTTLARASSIYNRQTRPLVRESADWPSVVT